MLSVYLLTLHPGVGQGDTAELQVCCPLLGVAHAPGYPIFIVIGRLFSSLPIGDSIAWRVNLLCAVFGAATCWLLFACARRFTGATLPAVTASLTLAFSSVFWALSVDAEVYTLYTAFLVAAIYSFFRWTESSRSAWLYLAALCYGCTIGNRPAEVFVLPAFIVCWIGARHRVKLRAVQCIAAAILCMAPGALSVAYVKFRTTPDNLTTRDNLLRDEVVFGTGSEMSWDAAIRFSAGTKWMGMKSAERPLIQQLSVDLGKYAWILSGTGAFESPLDPTSRADHLKQLEHRFGVTIGPIGLVLAAAGLWFGRHKPRLIATALALFVGNLLFYLYHHPPDNLTFVLPGLIGLCLLIGFGASVPAPGPWSRAFRWSFLAVPLLLLLVNWHRVDKSAVEHRREVAAVERLSRLAWPPNSTVVAIFRRAMQLRYELYVHSQREDVRVIFIPGFYGTPEYERLAAWLEANSQSLFYSVEILPPEACSELAGRTSPEFLAEGLYRVK